MSLNDDPSLEPPAVRKGGNGVRSSILSAILPEQFNDMISNDGRTTSSQPVMHSSSVSRSSSGGGTPHRKRRSLFFGGKNAEPEQPATASTSGSQLDSDPPIDPEHKQQQEGKERRRDGSPRGDKSTASNWRNWIGTDLASEANEQKRRSRSIEGKDVGKRLEKVKQKREARSKQREVKNTEMKSLMEQVASIAATSRGIMRAQPRQSEQQRLMGEIIVLMGKMADKMSKLMLATEPPDDDEDQKLESAPMTAEEADAKAEQILSLLSAGDDNYELEWKKLEIKSILTSETMHPRKRTTDKQKALEGLALGDKDGESRSSSRRASSRKKGRSKSVGGGVGGEEERDIKSEASSPSRLSETGRTKTRSSSLGLVLGENRKDTPPKLSKRQSNRSLPVGQERPKSESRSASRGASRGTSRSSSRTNLTKKRSSRSIGSEKRKKDIAPMSPIPAPTDTSWEPLNTPEGGGDIRLLGAAVT